MVAVETAVTLARFVGAAKAREEKRKAARRDMESMA